MYNGGDNGGLFGQQVQRKAMGAQVDDNPVGGGGGPMPVPDGGPHWRQRGGDINSGGGGGPMPIPEGGPHWRQNQGGFLGGPMGGPMPVPTGGKPITSGNPWDGNMDFLREMGQFDTPLGGGPRRQITMADWEAYQRRSRELVGGGGGPMPVPTGGPNWRNQGGGSADRWGNTGQVTSDGNGNTSAVTRGDVWGGVGPDPQGGLQLGKGGPDLRADWEKDQDYLRDLGYFALDTFMTPGGRGGPRQGTPEDYARWKASRGNGLYAEGTGFGGGGPMPVPTGGPNWRTPPTDQPVGGGGGPMPVPPPWVRFGGKPEDYGVTMEFGGPGAINPPGMGPNELRNLYNPPAPPPMAPNPQASPSPLWGNAGAPVGVGGQMFGPIRDAASKDAAFAPRQGGQMFAPKRYQNPVLPKRGGLGGQDNAPPPPMRDPRNFTPPPPMAAPQGGPVNPGLRGNFQGMDPNFLRYLLTRG